jgi:hypothetical protein
MYAIWQWCSQTEINTRKIKGKSLHSWMLNDILLNKPWVKEEVLRKIRKYFNWRKMKKKNANVVDEVNLVLRKGGTTLTSSINS